MSEEKYPDWSPVPGLSNSAIPSLLLLKRELNVQKTAKMCKLAKTKIINKQLVKVYSHCPLNLVILDRVIKVLKYNRNVISSASIGYLKFGSNGTHTIQDYI